jgi:hypothetical protein
VKEGRKGRREGRSRGGLGKEGGIINKLEY